MIIIINHTNKNADYMKLYDHLCKEADDVYLFNYTNSIKDTDIKAVSKNHNKFLLNIQSGERCLFINSQMEILTKEIVTKIKSAFGNNPKAKIIGGLINSHTGDPMWNNYGYEHNPLKNSRANTLCRVALNFWGNKDVMKYVKKEAKKYIYNFEKPKERYIDWVSELFFAVDMKLFKKHGGFDEKFKKYHKGPDLCKRAIDAGYKILFTPKIKAIFLETPSEGKKKKENNLLEDDLYWYKKHYGINRDTFMKVLYNPDNYKY